MESEQLDWARRLAEAAAVVSHSHTVTSRPRPVSQGVGDGV